MMKKLQLLSMVLLCIYSLQANEEDGLRGSIITQDNQVIAYNTAEGKRIFPFGESFSPALGYVSEATEGQKGIEQATEAYLYLGYDVHLHANLKLQKKLESILDKAKTDTSADEVIVAVMDSKTGKIRTMASSNRYDPGHIKKEDVPSIPVKYTEYPYEPGTVMSPFVLAIALEHNLLTEDTVFNIYNGEMEYAEGKYIKDVQKSDALSASNIIVDFSHIGMIQVSWLLSGSEFREGLKKFGFGAPSGIEFTRDLHGTLNPLYKFEKRLSKSAYSLGYGMMTTFTQLLKAYNIFNNDGISVDPNIISHTTDGEDKNSLKKADKKRVISKKTSKQMHNILVDNYPKKSNLNTKYPNLEMGGKKSTAKIFKHGQYSKEYHSSYYGFANDDAGNKYTISVLVIRPKDVKESDGSKSSFYVFEDVVEVMVEAKYFKIPVGEEDRN